MTMPKKTSNWPHEISKRQVVHQILKRHPQESLKQIAESLGLSPATVYSVRSEKLPSTINCWTEEEDELLRTYWRRLNFNSIRELLLEKGYDRTAQAVRYRGRKLGLKRTPNEVKRLMHDNNSGQFRKGHLPHNHRELGSVFRRSDGYLWIKTGDCPTTGTELLHRHLAEKHFERPLSEEDLIIGIGRPIHQYKTARALKRAFTQGKIKLATREDLANMNQNHKKKAETLKATTKRRHAKLHTYLTRLIVICSELEARYARTKSKLDMYLKHKEYAGDLSGIRAQTETLRKRLHCLKMAYLKARPSHVPEFKEYPIAI